MASTPSAKDQKLSDSQLEWIVLNKELNDGSIREETQKEKLIRKVKENPLIPVGCLATAAALSVGLYSMKQGDRQLSQYMMRARIAAQGFTVVALLVGIAAGLSKP